MDDIYMNKREVKLKNGKIIHLRHIQRQDVDCIWKIYNQVVDEGIYLPTFERVESMLEKLSWYNNLIEQENLCLVAVDPNLEINKNIVGQCTIENLDWETARHVATLGILIEKNYRNLGLGRKLIEYSIQEAKKISKKKLILTTLATNEYAIRLYKSIGFKEVGRYSKQYLMNDKYIDEILMEIFLN